MRIGKYTMTHNERCPLYVMEYIKERVENLVALLEKKLGNGFYIDAEQSRMSEACYLKIENEETGETCTVSFRNHKNYYGSENSADVFIFLSDFDTWMECKKFFLEKLVYRIESGEVEDFNYFSELSNWKKLKQSSL